MSVGLLQYKIWPFVHILFILCGRQTDRQTDRKTDKQTEIERERQAGRQTDKQKKNRLTDRDRDRDTFVNQFTFDLFKISHIQIHCTPNKVT